MLGHSALSEAPISTLPAAAGGGATYTLAADAGSFALTGSAAGVLRGWKVAAGAGSYTLTGQAAGVLYGRRLTAGAGAYNLTGQDAATKRGRLMAAGAGSFALTGQTAALLRGLRLTAGAGSFVLSGQAATPAIVRALTAGLGSYALSGQAASLLVGRVLAAAAGSYALTGQDATLRKGRSLTAGASAYDFLGQAAGLRAGRLMAAALGTFALTGQDATLNRGKTILAGAGSYALTGQDAAAKIGRRVAAGAGSYSLAGQAAQLLRGARLSAGAGSYTLNGQAASFALARRLIADFGAFLLSGGDAGLTVVGAAVVNQNVLFRIAAPIDTAADRAAVIAATAFGRAVTYTSNSGASEIEGLFLEPYAEPYSLPGIATAGPALLVAVDVLPADAVEGDTVTIEGEAFFVRALEPDGTGMVRLALEADTAANSLFRVGSEAESALDRAALIALDSFASTVTYSPSAGGALSIRGLFLEPFVAPFLEPGSATTRPALIVAADDIPSTAAAGDSVTIAGESFDVVALEPDGTGCVRLTLESASAADSAFRVAAAVDASADREGFASLDDFAVAATYTLAGGGASSVSGIFLEPYALAGRGPGAATSAPAFLMPADDMPAGAAAGDGLAIGSETFTVRALEPDGTGMMRLTLEETA